MRILLITFLFFLSFQAFSQGPVDRIELGYQTSRRGIVWVRPGLPTHEPAWRISRDTNSILWHNLTTGIRYDWSYQSSTWNRKDAISQTLPPIESITSGLATIDNTTADWINDNGISHFYDNDKTAWVPHGMSYQSLAPSDVAAGVSNAAATYTTTLWQDSDDFLIRYWDGDSWELIGGGTDLTFSGASSPVTLNSSTGTDVTITAGTGISLAATGTDLTISGTAAGLSKWTDGGATTYLTATGDNVAIGSTSASQKLDVTGSIKGSADLYLGSDFKIYSSGALVWNRNFVSSNLLVGNDVGNLTLTGNRNIGFGAYNLFSLTSGEQNVAIGQNALYNLTTGSGNVSIGINNLNNVTTGGNNVAVGGTAGTTVTTGSYNFLLGFGSGAAITSQSGNVAVGFRALHDVAAANNVGIGYRTLDGTGASGTVSIGSEAGANASTQTNSTHIGTNAGRSATAATSVFIGYGAGFGNTTNNTFAIDYNASLTSDKTPLLGGSFASTRVGINTAHSALAQTLHVTGTARITGSDGTATTIMGRDADGDISALSLSGMSISAGTLTATDGSTTNEAWTIDADDADTEVISNQTVKFQGGGIITTDYIPGTDILTITGTEVDGSVTNEAQALTVSGTTTGILTLASAGGAGGGTATIAAGAGITVGQSGGTITITNSSPATGGWLLDGNTITSAKRIGSNDNFDVVVETNGTDRMWFDNAGTVSIGATQLTTAQLNINSLGSTNSGLLIAGGSGLTAPNFISITGSGSGSNANVFNAAVSMLSGNVEAKIENTSGSGTGGALLTMAVNAATTGDPKHIFTTGTTTWSEGIDNSVTGEPFKITANTDLGGATPAISATTANKVGVNQAAATVTLQVTGTDGIGFPQGTTAQRPTTPAFPVLRWNQTFSGFEVWDPNKSIWYRLTGVSSPTVASNTAAGTGHSAGLVAGAGSNDVRGAIELTTGSASLTAGTVITVTYAAAYSGIKTLVTLTPANDPATTEIAKWRIDSQTQNGFTIRAVSALTANETYQFNYYVGQ